MKIVVTGALGHVGSRLIRDLPEAFPSSEIIMVDSMMTQRYCSLFNLPKGVRYKFIQADITQIELRSILKGADVAVHLAAITDAAGSFDQPVVVEQNNYNATRRLAEACVDEHVRLITPSSTSVYTPQTHNVNEDCSDSDLKPSSPYALTKLKEEALIRQLVREDGLEACVFRFGTIFGVSPGMRFHTAVNKFCWQAVMGQPLSVWQTAFEQTRPYLDIADACRAIIHAIKNNLFDGQTYNALTLNATVREIVDAIRIYMPSITVDFVGNKVMNQLSYEVSDARLRKTGYSPAGSLEKSLADEIRLISLDV